jgi:hypothetical protein
MEAKVAELFISYSRHDVAFVRRLCDALAARQREVWVDWNDIPPTAAWRSEIVDAIDAASVLIFVISQHSAASVEHLLEQDRRTGRLGVSRHRPGAGANHRGTWRGGVLQAHRASRRWNARLAGSHEGRRTALAGSGSVIAVVLIRESRGLLIGEGIRTETARAIRGIALAQSKVRDVGRVLSM